MLGQPFTVNETIHYDAYQCRSPEFSCQALIDSAPDSFSISRVDNHGYIYLFSLQFSFASALFQITYHNRRTTYAADYVDIESVS